MNSPFGYGKVAAVSTLLLSTLIASFVYVEIESDPSFLTFSVVSTIGVQNMINSTNNGKPLHRQLELDESISHREMLRMRRIEVEEKSFLREEEIRRRQQLRLRRNREARLEDLEARGKRMREHRIAIQERKLVALRRQEEDMLRREEETARRKERLSKERRARIDAQEEQKIIYEEHRSLRGGETMTPQVPNQETEVEIVRRSQAQIRRIAKLYTFVY